MEEIFPNHISAKGLPPGIYKEHIQLNCKKNKTSIKVCKSFEWSFFNSRSRNSQLAYKKCLTFVVIRETKL
jgi:hypothetical protein